MVTEINHEYYTMIILSLESENKMLRDKIKKLEKDLDEVWNEQFR